MGGLDYTPQELQTILHSLIESLIPRYEDTTIIESEMICYLIIKTSKMIAQEFESSEAYKKYSFNQFEK